MNTPYHVTSVEHLGGYRLRVAFVDGRVAEVDLTEKLAGEPGPVFTPLRDERVFAKVAVDDELGTIVWPNGADLAPDVLYEQAVKVG